MSKQLRSGSGLVGFENMKVTAEKLGCGLHKNAAEGAVERSGEKRPEIGKLPDASALGKCSDQEEVPGGRSPDSEL